MILELLWWIGWAWLAAWAALPLALVPVVGPVAGLILWAMLAPWTALLGVGTVHRLLPPSVAGTFRFPADRGAVRWAMKGWAPALYLTVFQPVFFHSRAFQRVVLRTFGARLGDGAWITSRTIVREPHHVTVGARSVIGEHAHLVCSYQPRPGLLLVAPIRIGDDTLVSAYTHVGPGAVIGSRCVVEHGVAIGARTRIGDDTKIGAGTTIYNGCRIGSGATIGKNCMVATGAVIEGGVRVPDCSVIAATHHAARRQEVP
jgi:acetyltransferase-like isoleucine patch superfamily enzyme